MIVGRILFCLILAFPTSTLAKNCGKASFYHEGTRTANGERFRPEGLSAAHRTLPMGTILSVTNGHRQVRVRINDRGPAAWTGRVIDLSRGAARQLGMLHAGVCHVCFTQEGRSVGQRHPPKGVRRKRR